ncbi:MAG TPA: nuclear transport factor 2 family protein [Pyrinomonadaceae bacterium]|nr:nuclear transport factor 2 family protein [Pyrinomonadaceae bacterium]
MNKIETVSSIYDAFGRGDIPGILDKLADDVAWERWEDNSAQKADVPWLRPRNNKEGVVEFFKIAGTLGIKDFQVLSLMEGENQVAAEIAIESAKFSDEEIHLWTFNEEGKISRFRHYVDTAKHIAAARD